MARRRRWEHPRETLRLQSVLGEGHFGQVSRTAAAAVTSVVVMYDVTGGGVITDWVGRYF